MVWKRHDNKWKLFSKRAKWTLQCAFVNLHVCASGRAALRAGVFRLCAVSPDLHTMTNTIKYTQYNSQHLRLSRRPHETPSNATMCRTRAVSVTTDTRNRDAIFCSSWSRRKRNARTNMLIKHTYCSMKVSCADLTCARSRFQLDVNACELKCFSSTCPVVHNLEIYPDAGTEWLKIRPITKRLWVRIVPSVSW